MTTQDLDLNLAIKGTDSVNKLTSGLEASRKSAETLMTQLGSVGKQIAAMASQAQKFQTAFANVSGGRSLGQMGSMMAKGSASSFLTNSAAKGAQSDFEASMEQVFARLTNKWASGMKDVVKSVQNSQVVALSKTTQSTPSNNLAGVNQQIEAQTYRVAQAQVAASKLSGAAQTSKLATYEKELQALNNLTVAQQKLTAAEAQTNAEAQRSNRVSAVLGDGGASLFKIQAGLLANYAVMGQVFSLFQFGTKYVVDFDASLKDLQAVTDSSNDSMSKLSKTFVEVSTETKYSAVDLAKAAVTLGQAGLSAAQIDQSIRSVALLATATGSDLATSVDVVTSALTVFNLTADQTSHIADVMTGALNLSKLTMDKLQLGIQYAGNTAAESGLSLEELVSSLGALSNAGIKSGSSLGTGLSQVLTEFQNPSKKLITQLKEVGLTVTDIDVKANGLTNVIQTMADAGFTASNAFAGMDLRGARAYVALSRNVDVAKNLEVGLQLTTAAAKANATQMESLANSGARLSNNFGAFILNIAEPFKEALIVLANLTSSFLKELNEFPQILQVVGSLLLAVIGGKVIQQFALLASGLFKAAAAFQVFAVAETEATVATDGLAVASEALAVTPLGRIVTVIGTVVAGLLIYAGVTDDTSSATNKLGGELEDAQGKFNSTQQSIESVGTEIDRLTDRYSSLSKNSADVRTEVIAMQTKFGDWTSDLSTNTIKTVDDLIERLQTLQGEMRKTALEQLRLTQSKSAQVFSDSLKNDSSEYTLGFLGRASTPTGPNADPSIGTAAGLRTQYAQFAKQTSGTDISTLSVADLGKLQDQFLGFRNSLQGVSNTIQSQITTITAQLNDSNSTLSQDQRDSMKATLDQLAVQRNKTQKALGSVIENANKLNSQVQFTNLDTQVAVESSATVTNLQKKVTDAAKALSDAKATGKVALIKAAQDQADTVEDEVNSKIGDIVKETGKSPDEVRNTINKTLDASLEGLQSQGQTAIDALTKGIPKANASYLSKLANLQNLSIDEIKRQITLATAAFDTKGKELQAEIDQMTDAQHGGLAGKYSDAEVSMLKDKQNDLQSQADIVKADQIRALLPKTQQVVDQQQSINDKAFSAYDSDQSNGPKLSAYIASTKDLNKAKDEQIALEQQLQVLDATNDARAGKEIEDHKDLGDQIEYSVEQYMKLNNIQNSFSLNIQKNITSVLDDATKSLGDYFAQWVEGSLTAGQAFKAFATSVLKSLADMAAKQAASSIFGAILKTAIGAVAGGAAGEGAEGTIYEGAPIGSAPINTGEIQVSDLAPPVSNRMGGMIRAAQGTMVPNVNRDSVHVLMQPGEGVVNKSAMQLLGSNGLAAINGNGNRIMNGADATAKAAAAAAAAQQSQEETVLNVYVMSKDAAPSLTKNDVIVTIADDLARNGTTAKLVKRIVV